MAKSVDFESFQLDLPPESVSFDHDSFDLLLRSHGVTFVLWRAMACPVGLVDIGDLRRPHEHHEDCSNGFILTKVGEITCAFIGNSKNSDFREEGRLDGSTVSISLPTTMDDGKTPVYIAPFDRFFLKENPILVPNWHSVQTHITGIDRLQFPAVQVQDLIDSTGKSYHEGADFCLRKGSVQWHPNKGPGLDPLTQKGRIYTIRYLYHPYWYISSLPHEVRVSQVEDDVEGRVIKRFPQQATLKREFHFRNQENDPKAPDPEGRQQYSPPSGGFGPR